MRTIGQVWLFIALATCLVVAQNGTSAPPADTRDKGSVLDTLPPEVAQQPAFGERLPRYRLHPSDVMEITFAFTPEFNQTLTIQPDGFITLKEVGDLHVDGLTLADLRTKLAEAYRNTLHDPVVTVVLKDFEAPYFTAGGEVGKPGKYDLRSATTLTEAVAIAGGFRDSAKHSEVLVFRRYSKDLVEVKKIDIKKRLRAGIAQEDLYLQAGDMIFVPKNRISRIKTWLPTTSLGMKPY